MAPTERTKLTQATAKRKSLRTTVPITVVRLFNLKVGDELEWEIKAEGGNLIIQVKPIKKT
jgi:bifunctional DNA-binding transcriptional regulator/antitoxin component of YhaV-PrlF toxin-antitoxin module